jgi:hypothetical protein
MAAATARQRQLANFRYWIWDYYWFKNCSIDAWKVFLNIALQYVAIVTGEVCEALEGAMGTVAHSVCVGVADEASLEDGHNYLAKGVVNYPITFGASGAIEVWGGGNNAGFGFKYFKGAIFAGLVAAGSELGLEGDEVAFEVVVEL